MCRIVQSASSRRMLLQKNICEPAGNSRSCSSSFHRVHSLALLSCNVVAKKLLLATNKFLIYCIFFALHCPRNELPATPFNNTKIITRLCVLRKGTRNPKAFVAASNLVVSPFALQACRMSSSVLLPEALRRRIRVATAIKQEILTKMFCFQLLKPPDVHSPEISLTPCNRHGQF